jgi:hypothetical protein
VIERNPKQQAAEIESFCSEGSDCPHADMLNFLSWAFTGAIFLLAGHVTATVQVLERYEWVYAAPLTSILTRIRLTRDLYVQGVAAFSTKAFRRSPRLHSRIS